VSEAEDVLLDAAHRAGAATRALWGRAAVDAEAPRVRAAAAERRIGAWLQAAFGATPSLRPCDPPPAPSWLERVLARPAPWRAEARAAGWTDGAAVYLPRPLLESAREPDGEALLLAALAQGLRLERGRAPSPSRPGIERDLRFVLEAALGDAELAARFPGLAPGLEAARQRERAARPEPSRLSARERGVEGVVVTLLRPPLAQVRDALERVLGVAPDPATLAAGARQLAAALEGAAGDYRGMAPVAHWGVPAGAPAAAVSAPAAGDTAPESRPRRRSLPRHVGRRAAEPEDDGGRTGPFVLPHGDPHSAVQDARGVVRPEDRGDLGEEELDALGDELARAGELPVVRGGSEVREVLEGEGGARRAPAEAPSRSAAGLALTYPEWDERLGGYRDPGIRLRELPVAGGDPAWAARMRREQGPLLAQVRRHFEALRPRRERIDRQLDGDLVDVDGIVAEHAERLAGGTPLGRLYSRERPRRRDVAVLLLLDASGSTDAWVSRGERVIDVARQACLCLGEALAALGDRHAIHAFSGRGPGDVRVQVAKRFAEPWSEAVSARLAAVEPDRATRLGGALRHATARLVRESAQTRVLLVLSDGKPDDEDVYEGSYGLADVRQAVFEARRAAVRTFCVTIDRAGPRYLPRLFGPAGYTVLWDVRQLPARLPAIYRRLAVA